MRWLDDNWPPLVAFVAVVVLLAGLIVWAVRDAHQWEHFKREHHCVQVAEAAGTVGVGTSVNYKGQPTPVTVWVPGSKSYRCDDGVVYTRTE